MNFTMTYTFLIKRMRVNICVNDVNKKLQGTKKCVIRRKLRVKNYDKYLEGKQFRKYT